MTRRQSESGLILLTVLVVMALAAVVVVAMATQGRDGALRLRSATAAARADALVQAAEASVIAARRADLGQMPRSDGPDEPWITGLIQDEIRLADSSFSVQIADAQRLYNLANGSEGADILMLLATVAGLSDEAAARVRAAALGRPMTQLADLGQRAGLTAAEIAALSPLVTALPVPTPVNVNSAPPEVLAAFFPQGETLARVLELRGRRGVLVPDDLLGLSIVLPQGLDLTSDFWRVTIRAEVDGAQRRVESLIGSNKDVRVISRMTLR